MLLNCEINYRIILCRKQYYTVYHWLNAAVVIVAVGVAYYAIVTSSVMMSHCMYADYNNDYYQINVQLLPMKYYALRLLAYIAVINLLLP